MLIGMRIWPMIVAEGGAMRRRMVMRRRRRMTGVIRRIPSIGGVARKRLMNVVGIPLGHDLQTTWKQRGAAAS